MKSVLSSVNLWSFSTNFGSSLRAMIFTVVFFGLEDICELLGVIFDSFKCSFTRTC